MTDKVMTDDEAQALFNSVGNAIREDDTSKLSSLLDESNEIQLVKEETPALEEVPETEETVVEEDTPPIVSEEVVEEVVETPVVDDELANLKAELAKVTKDNHALRSQAGRVPHVQRRLKELDEKLAKLTAAAPSSQTTAKIQPKVNDLLKGIRETDSELADTIAAVIAEATNGVTEELHNREKENLTALREHEYTQYQDNEASRLLEMYPNAPEVFSNPAWSEWKKAQTPAVRSLAESDSADDVAFAFGKYAQDMVIKYPQLASTPEVSTTEAVATATPEAEKAAKIEAERQRKQAASVTVGSPNATGKVGIPDDPQALFEKYSKEIRKQISG